MIDLSEDSARALKEAAKRAEEKHAKLVVIYPYRLKNQHVDESKATVNIKQRLERDAYERFDLDNKATPADFLDARTDGGKKGHVSDPLYWENIAAVCSFKEGALSNIKLYPVDQGHGRPRAQRGRPVLASGRVAGRILVRLQHLSHRYGTEVGRENDVGIINP